MKPINNMFTTYVGVFEFNGVRHLYRINRVDNNRHPIKRGIPEVDRQGQVRLSWRRTRGNSGWKASSSLRGTGD